MPRAENPDLLYVTGTTPDGNTLKYACGVTLRDLFAGMAMHAIYENPEYELAEFAEMANDAYSYADAMLAAREAGRE